MCLTKDNEVVNNEYCIKLITKLMNANVIIVIRFDLVQQKLFAHSARSELWIR